MNIKDCKELVQLVTDSFSRRRDVNKHVEETLNTIQTLYDNEVKTIEIVKQLQGKGSLLLNKVECIDLYTEGKLSFDDMSNLISLAANATEVFTIKEEDESLEYFWELTLFMQEDFMRVEHVAYQVKKTTTLFKTFDYTALSDD